MKKHSNTESDNYGIDVVERDDDYPPPLSKNRTIQAQALERAEILLPKEAGKPDKSVAEGLCIDVSTVRLCVKKYLEGEQNWHCMTDSAKDVRLKFPRRLSRGL